MRVQFYTTEDLEKNLTANSLALGVSISVLVTDILNKHYGLIEGDKLTDIQIEQRVFAEIKQFVKDAPVNNEFDLNQASDTYRKISMVYAGKPHILKARLGRKFAGLVGTGDFVNVEQVMIHGKPKKTVENRAAIYKICANTKGKAAGERPCHSEERSDEESFLSDSSLRSE